VGRLRGDSFPSVNIEHGKMFLRLFINADEDLLIRRSQNVYPRWAALLQLSGLDIIAQFLCFVLQYFGFMMQHFGFMM
jgi:hypothetical protein